MTPCPPCPLIGVSACLRERDQSFFHSVQRKYVDAILQGVGGLPLILPAVGGGCSLETVLDRLDGLLLTGSPSNVGAEHYGGPVPREDDIADPARDGTTLPLIRAAVARGLPILAICRGIQELNVALGGSLHQHVHELPGHFDHRSDKTRPPAERYEPRHEIRIVGGGRLQDILGGAETILVNSLHGQGIDRLAEGLVVEAQAHDGTIEAVAAKEGSAYLLGVQWHPEYKPVDDPWSQRIFASFGDATRSFARSKVTYAGLSRVA